MNKSTIIAILVFVALAAAAAATLREKPERGITHISFASIDPEKTDRIVVEGPHPAELVREGDTWKLGNQRADAGAVTNALNTVKRIESSEVVSRNQTRFAGLEVEGDKAVHVQTFANGVKTADFVIGSTAPGGANVRVDDTVYLVKGAYKGAFTHDRTQWLDRKLFADKVEDATRVEVKLTGQKPYALVKDDKSWKLEDPSVLPQGFRFDRTAATALVTALVSAQASDVFEAGADETSAGLGDVADTLSFEVASGEPRSLRLGAKKDDTGIYARASTRPELVMLAQATAKNLRKPLADLRDLSLMEIDVSAAKRLTIANGKDRLVLEKDGETWKVAESSEKAPEKFEFDPMAVSRRLAAIRTARAVGIASGDVSPDKAGLDKPSQTVSITSADDRTVTLAFGKDTKLGDAAAVYARGNADGEIYAVTPFTRDNVLGGIQTFAKREDADSPLAGLDPKALSNLPPEIRDSLMKQIEQKRQQQETMKRALEKAKTQDAAQ